MSNSNKRHGAINSSSESEDEINFKKNNTVVKSKKSKIISDIDMMEYARDSAMVEGGGGIGSNNIPQLSDLKFKQVKVRDIEMSLFDQFVALNFNWNNFKNEGESYTNKIYINIVVYLETKYFNILDETKNYYLFDIISHLLFMLIYRKNDAPAALEIFKKGFLPSYEQPRKKSIDIFNIDEPEIEESTEIIKFKNSIMPFTTLLSLFKNMVIPKDICIINKSVASSPANTKTTAKEMCTLKLERPFIASIQKSTIKKEFDFYVTDDISSKLIYDQIQASFENENIQFYDQVTVAKKLKIQVYNLFESKSWDVHENQLPIENSTIYSIFKNIILTNDHKQLGAKMFLEMAFILNKKQNMELYTEYNRIKSK